MSKRLGIRKIAYTALFVALIVVGGFIRIPIGPIPITLQLIFVLLAGSIGGKGVGFFAPLIYLLIGLAGIPVFSAGGGITYALYPTFGYLASFPIAGFISGLAKKGFPQRLACNFIAVAVVHIIGVIYFYLMGNIYLQTADIIYNETMSNPIYSGAKITPLQAFMSGSLVFIPLDLISAIVGALLSNKIVKIINRT